MKNKLQATMYLLLVCIFFLIINVITVAAQEAVSMVKSLNGDSWVVSDKSNEKTKVTMMLELEAGDLLKVGKGSDVTVIYYQSTVKEKYLEDSMIEIGIERGIVHKGNAIILDDFSKRGVVKTKAEILVSSRGQEMFGSFTLRGDPPPPPPPSKYFDEAGIRRYAVIIGISKFKDPHIPSLKYADRDAQSFYDYLMSNAGGSFYPDNVLLLKNEEAILKNVKGALTAFLKRAVVEDFVIVYIASHGEPEPDRPSNLFILTQDSELDKLASTAYHMENVLLDMKRYISARRLIFFADACHAGGMANDKFGKRGYSNTINTALSALSKTSEGWAMVTASRASEVSLESEDWGDGHGAFTYFLLEGLKGKADVAGNYNGIVTITEAFDYLENKVRKATKNAQHPAITGDFDNNLPIGFLPVKSGNTEAVQPENSTGNQQTVSRGVLSINSTEDDANIFLNGKFIGKTSSVKPFDKNIPAGSAKLYVKKKGLNDFRRLVYINPDEISEVYVVMSSGQAVNGNNNDSQGLNIVTGVGAANKKSDPPLQSREPRPLTSKSDKLDLLVLSSGDPDRKDLVKMIVSEELAHKKSFHIVDINKIPNLKTKINYGINSVEIEELPGIIGSFGSEVVPHIIVTVNIKTIGKTELKYFGRMETMFITNVSLEAMFTTNSRIISTPIVKQVKFTNLNMYENIETVLRPMARKLVNNIEEFTKSFDRK